MKDERVVGRVTGYSEMNVHYKLLRRRRDGEG